MGGCSLKLAFLSGILGLALVGLAGCGGGGSSGGGGGVVAINRAPIAVAGSAQTAVTGAVVTFNGSGSSDPDGDTLTYAWTLTSKPAGSTASLGGATTATPSFRADKDGAYQVSLVVSDAHLSSAAATTSVTAAGNSADLAAATAASVTVTLDVSGGSVQLQWKDTFPAGASYRIEQQAADGTFEQKDILAGLGGANALMTWSQPYTGQATYRIMALNVSREIPLLSPAGQPTLTVDTATTSQIVVNQPDPLTGSVQLSVAPPVTGATVSWYSDLSLIGTGNPFTWNTVTTTNGQHLIVAQLDNGAGVRTDLRRSVTTSNADINISDAGYRCSACYEGNEVAFYISAGSSVGISKVEASLDGGAPTVLTAPNTCGNRFPCTPSPLTGQVTYTAYRFSYVRTNIVSGSHTWTFRATDNNGGVKQISITAIIANGAVLTFSPITSFPQGTLQVQGSYTSDTGQPATVQAFLGSLKILETTATPFSTSFSLAGVTPGQYTLTVRATASNGASSSRVQTIVVGSGSAPIPALQVNLQAGASVLAVGPGGHVLAKNSDDTIVLYGPTGSVLFALDIASLAAGSNTSIDQDYVYAAAYTDTSGPCPTTRPACIFRWSIATGARTELSAGDPAVSSASTTGTRSGPVLRGRYALWRNVLNTGSSLTLLDMTTGAFTLLSTPNNPGGIFTIYGWTVEEINGAAAVYVLADPAQKLFKWTSAEGFTTLAANTLNQSLAFNTDGQNLYMMLNNVLSATPLAGGATVQLSTIAVELVAARGGVVVWRESNIYRAWSATQGPTTLTTSANPSTSQMAGGGLYGYYKSPFTYVWSGTTGASTIRADGGPYPYFIVGSWLYFQFGDGVYRTPLS